MRRLSDALIRAKLRMQDWARLRRLRRFAEFARMLGCCVVARSHVPDAVARFLSSANSSTASPRLVAMALRQAQRSPPLRAADIRLDRSILLKPAVDQCERGVLLVSFESQLEELLRSAAFEEVEQRYLIAFLPTWQPAHSRALFLLAARARLPYVVMPASQADLALPNVLGKLCCTVPLQASNWSSASDFARSASIDRDIDILMVANFAGYKRHWRLFEGLTQLSQPLRVVLAGTPWEGRHAVDLLREARAFGVTMPIEIVSNPSNPEIASLMRRARLLCALSHKEGSYIAVAEALLAGTPVAMFRDAVIGSKIFINDKTGILLERGRSLGPQLLSALRVADSLDPRDWAARTISAEASGPLLNSALQRVARSHGERWSMDIAAFACRRFTFLYRDPASLVRLQPDYARLRDQLGVTLPLPQAAAPAA
jgi:glycosyltransferase involved in cell wall biosynthesis